MARNPGPEDDGFAPVDGSFFAPVDAPLDPGSGTDDILDAGHAEPRWYSRLADPTRRHPAWTRTALWVAAGLVIGVAATTALTGRGHRAASSDSNSAPTAQQTAMSDVLALAHSSGTLADYVRQTSPYGSCVVVAPGRSPTDAIVRAVRSALPGLTDVDTGQTLDQFTGLCSIQLRATYQGVSTVTLSIAAPTAGQKDSPYAAVEVGVTTNGGTTTKYIDTVTEAGWTVLLGATGPSANLPAEQDLVTLAEESALTW